jgi:colanic acid biosynthesis glycosyl transferase WcaI
VRIGIISQWYDPEVGAAATFASIARTLAERGHEVLVVTGFPNYPSGTIYPGYRQRFHHRETVDGIQVHRAPLYASHDRRTVGRAANYLSFAMSGTVVTLSALKDVDVVLACSGPMTAAIPAVALNAMHRVPYALLVQDMWPQSVTASGFRGTSPDGKIEHALERLCDAVYRRAAAIAVTSPGMAPLIAERGVPSAKITMVANWADETYFRPVSPRPSVPAEFGGWPQFAVMYAGNLGEVQDLGIVVEAADLLRDRADIGFVFVGGGVAEASLWTDVRQRKLANVRFLGSQPRERMSDILALGDVQLICLRDLPVFRSTLPSKIQATLAAGRPIIGAVAGDAAAIIDASGAGVAVPPGSAPALAAAIDRMSRLRGDRRDRLGRNGRTYYETELGRAAGGARLETLLHGVATVR